MFANADEAAKKSGSSPTLESIKSEYRVEGAPEQQAPRDILLLPPIRATQRKRGKSMSRRKGQNPKLLIGTRSDGSQYFYFQ